MTFINYASREINCKIVYYGPGLCGKTTNLQYIFDSTAPQSKGKLISLATETDRTLFFDFMPLELGTVRGFKTRFHLYTVPGQVFYDASRKLILKGVDGVVFVADSQEERMDANIESLYNLEENLQSQGYDLMNLPYVLQLNKRDLPNVIPVAGHHGGTPAQGRARLRGGRRHGRRRLRHAQGRGEASPDGAAQELKSLKSTRAFSVARLTRLSHLCDDAPHAVYCGDDAFLGDVAEDKPDVSFAAGLPPVSHGRGGDCPPAEQ